jgi:hypothetical protein
VSRPYAHDDASGFTRLYAFKYADGCKRTSEIEILKRQYDTRLNRNGKGTQRSDIAA